MYVFPEGNAAVLGMTHILRQPTSKYNGTGWNVSHFHIGSRQLISIKGYNWYYFYAPPVTLLVYTAALTVIVTNKTK